MRWRRLECDRNVRGLHRYARAACRYRSGRARSRVGPSWCRRRARRARRGGRHAFTVLARRARPSARSDVDQRGPRLPGRRSGARDARRTGPRRIPLCDRRRGARRVPAAGRDRRHRARARAGARTRVAGARGGARDPARRDRARHAVGAGGQGWRAGLGATGRAFVMRLESPLRARRDEGRKLLVPYVTGGLGREWCDVVRAVVDAGADAVEVGIPFSDPIMDGRTIQEASQRALDLGATPAGVISAMAGLDVAVPTVVMTYYNLVGHMGHRRAAQVLQSAGVAGAILPDLPFDELDGWGDAADYAGIATVLLAAPTTPDDRLKAICERSRGFVYGVSLLGVTGERSALPAHAERMGKRCKAVTDRPVLLGVGISTPEQASQAAAFGDGVIVGSALVRRLLDGGGANEAAAFVSTLRTAL